MIDDKIAVIISVTIIVCFVMWRFDDINLVKAVASNAITGLFGIAVGRYWSGPDKKNEKKDITGNSR